MSKNDVRFFTEGKADKLLLEILEIDTKFIEKSNAISKLKTKMKKQFKKNFHHTIVGIADYDKGRSLEFFKEFELCAEPDNILLKRKPNSNQYIIFLKPKAIERWILDSAESVNLKPEDYKLSSRMKDFIKQTKHLIVSNNKELVKFIRAIKKANAEPFMYLQDILHSLLNQKEYPCKTS